MLPCGALLRGEAYYTIIKILVLCEGVVQIRFRTLSVSFLLFFISISFVQAGSFKVFPLRLDLDQKTKTTLFKISNTGDQAVTIQLESALWFQDDSGEDQYKPTSDIVFFPKIVKVAKGEQRIIRIGYRGGPANRTEKSYRIFAQELPERSEKSGNLSFALRFSVPIFVHGKNNIAKPQIADAKMKNGSLSVRMKNVGGEHLIVKSVSVSGKTSSGQEVFTESAGGWYVLPNSIRDFLVNLPEEPCVKAKKLDFSVQIADKFYSNSIPVNVTECVMLDTMENKRFSFEQ